jgi:peptide/nickel transport system substrate-binding protein
LESEKDLNSLVFRGLTKIDSTGKVVADLAERIETKGNSEYIFYLKKNVLWHDGRNFSADDVVYSINLTQNSLYQSVAASNFKDVTVEKIDNYTVSFKLKEPFAPFLTITTLGIIPKHIKLTDYRPVGTGKFRFVEIKEESVALESENLKLKFRFYPTLEVAKTALKLGEVHAIVGIDSSDEDLLEWENFRLYQSTLPYRQSILFFNTRDQILKEKLVRQALAYSIPKEEIAKFAKNSKGKIAVNSFAEVDFLDIDGKEKYLLNLEKAAQLLSTAGWQKQENFYYKDGQKLTLTITTLSDKEFLDTAKKIQSSWKKLGVDVEINIVSGVELKEQIVPNKIFTVLLSSQLLNSDPDQYVLWHTTQATQGNITGIASPKLDKLLEDGRKSLDLSIRKEKYQEFSRIIGDEVPAVFLYYPKFVWICSTRVKNINLKDFREPADRFLSSDDWVIENPVF